jgi:arylsulfatase A-like enzyme
MSTTTPAGRRVSTRPAHVREVRSGLRPLDVLILSAWSGLAGGLLEVGARVASKNLIATNRLYLMSRHFLWLTPLTNLIFFAGLGLFLALAAKLWPRVGGWVGPRLIGLLAILPVLVVMIPQIYPLAWTILALGIALRLAAILERHSTGLRRRLLFSFPGLLGFVLILAGWDVGGEWLAERREAGRLLPPGDPPNVLLITLDTVRADHLSLYGYQRPTSPVLERLARWGVRFDEARAAAPWTLPSHATMFTGRWHHELSVNWMTPLDRKRPTLAEYLGARGYATAGFVANTISCSYDTGLDRGFTHYEDYILEYLLPFRTAWLVDHVVGMIADLGVFVGRTFDIGPFRPMEESWVSSLFVSDQRKDAGSISRAFMDWLSRRRQPARPFFAFLNYYDAHAPYVLPAGAGYRFGLKPRRAADFIFLIEEWEAIDKLNLRPSYRELARDSYDNCVAFLDERLGELLEGLLRSGVLDRTLVIVTADHGEGMGEHDLFDHGESLYRPEIRVPLLIVLPAGRRCTGSVRETVSLRDLPATILDLVGLEEGSPFPGRSLAHLWRDPSPGLDSSVGDAVISELLKPNPIDPNRGRSPAHRGPLISLAEGDFVYIRNTGDGSEELYNEREDPGEVQDLSRVAAMQPVLERLRRRLDQSK